jgi:branched-chain amino acid transport system substrate-binding protein
MLGVIEKRAVAASFRHKSLHFLSVRVLAASAAAALVVSGLTAGVGASGSAAAASPIVVGAIGSFTGVTGQPSGKAGLVAWVDSVNASGGINGHKVKLILDDSGASSTADVTDAHQLIQSDHVVAILDNDSADVGWLSYAASQHVPVIAGLANVAPMTSPYAFPTAISPVALAYLILKGAKQYGGSMGFAYCAETPDCAGLNPLFTAFSPSVGEKVPVTLKLSSTLPDYTSACQAWASAGVTSVFLAMDGPVVQKIVDTCHQQGLKAHNVFLAANAAPYWKTDPAVTNGSLGVDEVPLDTNTSVPGVAKYRAALRKYDPSIIGTVNDNSYGLDSWATGAMFQIAAAKVKGSLSTSSIYRALGTIKNETLGGITGPLTYAPGQDHSNNDCGFFWEAKGGKYIEPNAKPQCAPAAALAPVLKQVVG